ncbi:uncharacterized protein BXZ73DRAFT_51524, partial [Epithele typhae]|uniref:uncharacterized protein n=1 Tax=Epithele typhae TaxID=378194 RepID=UPI0020077809
CVICGDAIRGTVVSVSCGHSLDIACLCAMFERASHDESLFPPKCCRTPIELAPVQHHLPSILRTRYAHKQVEVTTADRVYCHTPTCSAFLGPHKAHDAAAAAAAPGPSGHYVCTACGGRTCTSCKTAAHPGRACAEADLQRDVLALGREKGWQRCPACRHLVELSHGCHHVTCRCAQQFCYRCGMAWKMCVCPSYRVVGEPGAVVAGGPPPAAPVAAPAVVQARRALVAARPPAGP